MVEEEVAAAAPTAATGGSHQDLPQIVKGKRTKRQKPQSPIPFTVTTQHSSSGEGGYISNGDCINNNNNNDHDHNHNTGDHSNINIINNNHLNTNSSSSSAEHFPQNYAITEEDEYTAKLLILLAQGQGQHHNVVRKEASSQHHKFDQDHDYGVPEKFNSKRYIEAPISGNGKAGMYVYECKTCGRTFPSFQALGGHRASHKKPRNIAAAQEKRMFMDVSDEEEEIMTFKRHKINGNNNNNNCSSLSLEFVSCRGISSNNNNNNNNNTNLQKSASFPRIHECSHCGAEFASGQALGGHMRRHRGAPAIANTTLSLGQLSPETLDQDSDQEAEAKRIRNGLTLDLNLPAPEDDHHHHHNKESKFGLASKQQQQQKQKQQEEEKKPALVLSTTTKLVDCHY